MPADADQARRAAEQLLSGPEYRQPSTPWWQKALNWIDDLYQRLIGGLSGSGGGSILGWLVVVVVLAGAAAVVVVAIRTLRRSPRRSKPDAPEQRRRRGEPKVDWNDEADRLEAEGRWRDGLRARYRGLVAELSRRHLVDPAVSRTTGEHRREIGSTAPPVAGDFADAAELFDRAWYGGRDTGPTEAARFGELARAVRDERSLEGAGTAKDDAG